MLQRQQACPIEPQTVATARLGVTREHLEVRTCRDARRGGGWGGEGGINNMQTSVPPREADTSTTATQPR